MIRSTFAIPIILAALTLAGLVVALTGDGWRDVAGWAGLSMPLLAILRAASGRHSRKDMK